ncbi:MAG: winged helix-turn-helix transcriptional regulator [Thaumarchaeota archaeon]|nr:winged helix-turn-helix transcriptional regulator [Nitrososphaerota archaeon]
MSFEGLGVVANFVVSSEVRSKVLARLTKAPMTPTELASVENKHVSHVSRALAELRAQGLIEPISNQTREKKYRVTYRGLVLSATVGQLLK